MKQSILGFVAGAALTVPAWCQAVAPVPPVPPTPPAAFAFRPEPPEPPEPPPPPAVQIFSASGSFLGVNVQEVDAERAKVLKLKEERGVEITTVQEDSPAETAGLKKGDVVLEYNGQRVEGTEQFIRFVRETPAGRAVKLSIVREGTPQTVAATIGSRKGMKVNRTGEWFSSRDWREFRIPDIPRPLMGWSSGSLGVEVESVTGQLAQYFGVKEGVLVRSVAKDSPAEKAGLKAGDVVVKVDSKEVDSPSELSRALRERGANKSVSLSVFRDRRETSVTVNFDEGAGERRPAPRATRVVERKF